jgi:hypothetical protein
VFFTNLPIVKLIHDTAYLAITYWKKVQNYLIQTRGGGLFSNSKNLRYRAFLSADDSSCIPNLHLQLWFKYSILKKGGGDRPSNWPRSTGKSWSTVCPPLLYCINGYYNSSIVGLCGFICNISLLCVNPLLLLYEIFLRVWIPPVYMFV